MIRVSGINEKLPPRSAREKRLGQVNLALATLDVKRRDQLRAAEAELARLRNDLAQAEGSTLVDVVPFINAVRQYVGVIPNQGVAVDPIPADLDDTMDALGLDDAVLAGVVGAINRVSRNDIVAFLRGPGVGETVADFLDEVDAAGNVTTSTAQKIAQISALGAGADAIPVDTDRTTAAFNLYLENKQTPVTDDEAAFLNGMRELITVIDALKVVQATRPDNYRDLTRGIQAWLVEGDGYERGNSRVRELRDDIDRAQQDVEFLRQLLDPAAQNEELDNVRANLRGLRAEISNVDILERNARDVPGLRSRLLLAREDAARGGPEEYPDMAVVEAQAGDMLEFSFEVDSAADEIRISAETFDLPMSAQLRSEVPGFSPIATILVQLRDARARVRQVQNVINELDALIVDLEELFPATDENDVPPLFALLENVLDENVFAPAVTQAFRDEIARLRNELVPVPLDLDPFRAELLVFARDFRTEAQDVLPRLQVIYSNRKQERDSTGWWLAHRLAYIQDQRDEGLVYQVYVNGVLQGDLGVSADQPLIPVATTLTGLSNGTYTIRARATSAYTGPLVFTLQSYVASTFVDANGTNVRRTTRVDSATIPVRIRVKERCMRSGKSVAALEQDEFGKCVFTIGPTSWETARLNELKREVATAQGEVARLERERDQAAVSGPGLVSADERQLRVLNARDAVDILESESANIRERIRRRQGTFFRGYYCASSLLLSPPSPLTPLKRPDEVCRFDYSAITGPEYSTRDLIFFQRTQAIGLGAMAPVELPVTPEKLTLFDARDPATRAYLLGDYNPGSTTSFLTGQNRQVILDLPGRVRPLVPNPVRTKITLDLPEPVEPKPRFTIKPSSLSPTPTNEEALLIRPAPVSDPDEQYSESDSEEEEPVEPTPVRTPPVDPSILKGETEVFEADPEPEPRARQPSKLEKQFAIAVESPLDKHIPVPRNDDGTVALGVPFLRFVEHMSKLEQRTAQLEMELMKNL